MGFDQVVICGCNSRSAPLPGSAENGFGRLSKHAPESSGLHPKMDIDHNKERINIKTCVIILVYN